MVFEETFETTKLYQDPWNDVDVDVVFSKDGQSWRVPTFWRGGSRWSVRFGAPEAGEHPTAWRAPIEPIRTSMAMKRS